MNTPTPKPPKNDLDAMLAQALGGVRATAADTTEAHSTPSTLASACAGDAVNASDAMNRLIVKPMPQSMPRPSTALKFMPSPKRAMPDGSHPTIASGFSPTTSMAIGRAALIGSVISRYRA